MHGTSHRIEVSAMVNRDDEDEFFEAEEENDQFDVSNNEKMIIPEDLPTGSMAEDALAQLKELKEENDALEKAGKIS